MKRKGPFQMDRRRDEMVDSLAVLKSRFGECSFGESGVGEWNSWPDRDMVRARWDTVGLAYDGSLSLRDRECMAPFFGDGVDGRNSAGPALNLAWYDAVVLA